MKKEDILAIILTAIVYVAIVVWTTHSLIDFVWISTLGLFGILVCCCAFSEFVFWVVDKNRRRITESEMEAIKYIGYIAVLVVGTSLVFAYLRMKK